MANALAPNHLRTEYALDPLGIDVEQPRFSWRLAGTDYQQAYQIRVSTSPETLPADDADAWDSGRVESDTSIHIIYKGATLAPSTRYSWQVRVDTGAGLGPWSDVACFETGLLDTTWDADWIAGEATSAPTPAPLLRTTVAIDEPIERARAYVAAAGYYDLYVNGERIGDHVLDTGFTDYEERVLYATHDLTDDFTAGNVAIGLELGRDWYALTTENVWGWERAPWHQDQPCVRLQLVIEYADGSVETITTDESWRTTPGPRRYDSIYCGEIYDARKAIGKWANPAFDDADWATATVVDGPAGDLVAQQIAPMRELEAYQPVTIEPTAAGTHVFDFGIVTAGWVELSVEGPAGTIVKLTYGERRHDDGTVDVEQRHIDCAHTDGIQTDSYVLEGTGTETWTPRFSYKGFRYVEVAGLPNDPTAETLTARAIHTPLETASESEFSCTNALLNRIHENSRRTFLNNCHSIPTDTPVYEKNGWTGDAQVGAEMALFNFDLDPFFTKWLADFADAQRADGELPPIVPTSDWGYSDRPMDGAINSPNPGWDVAYVLIPWWTYQYCGDRRLLDFHFEGMKGVTDWTGTFAEEYIVTEGLGDWLAPTHTDEQRGLPPEGPAITSTAFYYKMAATIAAAADVLDRPVDQKAYATLAADIKAAFNDTFLDPHTGIYATGEVATYRQTSNVFPLAFDLVPDEHVAAVVEQLVADVAETHDGHLNTGFHGTKYLLPVLTAYGHLDLAYEVATQTTYPSWGHWIDRHGATTIYEAWELSSRSRDHYAYGAIDEWFYKDLAGIRPASPGFAHVDINPHVPSDLDSVSATVDTVSGVISTGWSTGDGFELDVSIPAGVTATVHVPGDADPVLVDGVPVTDADALTNRDHSGDREVVDVGAGEWTFTRPQM